MRDRILIAVLVLVLIALPLFPGTPEYWITLLNYIGLYAMVALGLVLLTGVGGLTSFGQAAFVGIGAYATAYLCTVQGLSPWFGLAAGLALTAAVAYGIGAITLRLSGHYLPLSTIAWGLSLYYLLGNMEWFGRHDGMTGVPVLTLFGWPLAGGRRYFFLIWTLLLLTMLATRNLLDSRPGRAIRALKGAATMAESCGVDTARYKIFIFVYAALLASVSGWLYAHMQRAVNPTPFGLQAGIEYLFMAVIGGAGHVWGALLGAGLLTLLKDSLQDWLPKVLGRSGNFEIIVFGVLMVLLLQYAREGIWPQWLRWFSGNDTRRAPASNRSSVLQATPDLASRTQPRTGDVVLELRGVRKNFGGLVAVNDVGFAVRAGEILGLIGPNGAGKSTIFNLISGMSPASAGEVEFRGRRIERQSARAIAKLGLGRTFQHVRLLPAMTVLENAVLGAHLRAQPGPWAAMLRLDRAREAQLLAAAAAQLQRVGLGECLHEQAGNLALGRQRLLEIARALALDPMLLLLDEPAAGLRYREKQALADVLRQLQAQGMTILLVEHDMDFVMGLADRLVVMDFGVKLAEGLTRDIQSNPLVLEAYLGGVA